MLFGIHANEVDQFWPMLSKHIEKAMKFNDETVTLDDIRDKVVNRDYQLWAIVTDELIGAAVSYIEVDGEKKAAWVYALGGKGFVKHAKRAMYEFQCWAKANGADVVRLRGRPGWLRIFPDWEVKDRFIESRIQ